MKHEPPNDEALKSRLMPLYLEIRTAKSVDLKCHPLSGRVRASLNELIRLFPIEKHGHIVVAVPEKE
jgi:hypothetical protein